MNRIEPDNPGELVELLRTPFMVELIADNLGIDPRRVDQLLQELGSEDFKSVVDSSKSGNYVLYTDGASRNNPGPASGGAVLYDDAGEKISENCQYFSSSLTNNAAEYLALLLGLDLVPDNCEKLTVCMDSQLIIRQLQGEYAVKSANLRPYYQKAIRRLQDLGEVDFKAIPREQNSEADALANRALDLKIK
ncbi:MAG: ribonuclease HI family protein [bacterium]